MAIYEIEQSQKSPTNTKGPIKWVLDNLVATPTHVIFSFLILGLLYITIPPFITWAIIDANFIGTTKASCTGDGACWVFIIHKMDFFIYGFYPESEIYRINWVFGLSIIFLLLFKYTGKTFKAKIALFSLFPIIAYFLITGGSFGLVEVPTDKWGGLMLTLIISSIGIVVAMPVGIILAFGRQSKLPIIKSFSIVYIEFVRGVPLITILFMGSVILPMFFPEGMTFDKLLRVLIVVTLFQAAYVAEVIRGGLQAIPKGQYEAADSEGLSYWQKMLIIILPQVIKVSIPNLVGNAIGLFKDTTLVLIIGLFDLLTMVGLTSIDSHWTGFATEGYVFVGFIFLIFCSGLSRYSKVLEDRLNTENR
ncbi:amino acid ABC transporter permease [Psychromonas hadalis]|uniref:amino acid ABC transporter permease n=1 Tax=Psychromonas hadalis TaxID=211669 RepID=UPI0003B74ED6|nr:amino acid ABC transporter permease [Psychromonas hadalis]